MTENVKHVEVLRKLQAAIFLPSDKTLTELEAEQIRALDAAIAALQREAAGDGEGLIARWRKRAAHLDAEQPPVRQWVTANFTRAATADTLHVCANELEALTAPRPAGTLQERLSQDTVLGRNVLPSPASAEPGEAIKRIADTLTAMKNSVDYPMDSALRTSLEAWIANIGLALNTIGPDARGGGEAVDLEEIEDLIETPFDAGCCNANFPIAMLRRVLRAARDEITSLRSHPTPAALDAEDAARYRWLRQFDIGIDHQGYDDYRWYAYAKPEPKHGRFGLDAAIDAARATTGARHE